MTASDIDIKEKAQKLVAALLSIQTNTQQGMADRKVALADLAAAGWKLKAQVGDQVRWRGSNGRVLRVPKKQFTVVAYFAHENNDDEFIHYWTSASKSKKAAMRTAEAINKGGISA